MKRDSFILYADAYDSIRSLTDEQKGQLLDLIFCFCREEEPPKTDQITAVVFSFIQRSLERDARKYEKRCEKARMAARMRWDANACERIPSNAQNADNDTDTDTDHDNIICPQQADGPPPCPHEEIISLYHKILPELRMVRSWNDTRRKYLRSRWREDEKRQSIDWWGKYFKYVKKSSFLCGLIEDKNGRTFSCDLEWLVKPTNFVKVIEGKYHE